MHVLRSSQSTWRKQIAVLVVGLFAALTLVALPSQGAQAAGRARVAAPKVTICHRTHATTNPYRMITVSAASVDAELNVGRDVSNNNIYNVTGASDHAGELHNGVNNSHVYQGPDTNYAGTPDTSKVFNPTFNYAPNNKVWQDIIPPFVETFSSGGGTVTVRFAGLNWTPEGKAIYYGTTLNGVDYSGLCGVTGAKQFAQNEYNEWLRDNPNPSNGDITSKKNQIINDLQDQGADGDGTISNGTDLDNLPSADPKPKGPNKPAELTTLQNNLDTQNSGSPSTIKQALAGLVWRDMNRNGLMDNGERAFQNVSISVKDPVTGKELTSADLGLTPGTDYSLTSYNTSVQQPTFSFANFINGSIFFHTAVNTVTVTTDANGYFQIPYLPDGEWQVVVTTPDGWTYTYDSNGGADGDMPGTIVPVGGVGFAWAGLVYTGPGTYNEDGTITPALANTGQNGSWYIAGVVALELIVTGVILLVLRRRAAAKIGKR